MPTDRTQKPTPSQWRLSKFHGLGNSFLVKLLEVSPAEFKALQNKATDSIAQAMEDLLEVQDLAGLTRQLCNAEITQNSDEVADGLIVGLCPFSLENPTFSLRNLASQPTMTIGMLLRNADGSNGQVSGNGLRCLAHAVLRAINPRNSDPCDSDLCNIAIEVLTDIGIRKVEVSTSTASDVSEVTASVSMGSLELSDSVLPEGSTTKEAAPKEVVEEAVHKRIEEFLRPSFASPTPHFRAAYASIGNPHLVIEVADLSQAFTERSSASKASHQSQLIELGNTLTHKMTPLAYPAGINVELIAADNQANITNGSAIQMFVWERGVGITQACGTGAVVAAAQAAKWGLVDGTDLITVRMPGGDAQVLLPSAQASKTTKELTGLEPILVGPSVLSGDLIFDFNTQQLMEV